MGSTRRVLAGQPAVLEASPRVLCTFSLRSKRPGQPEVCAASPRARRAFFPLQRAARAARGLAPSPLVRCAFSLRGPSARRWSGLRKSLDRNRGLFVVWEGVASLGLSLPLSSPCCLLPPSLDFLSPFVLRTAGGVFRPVNFSLLSHSLKGLPPIALGAFGRSLP